MNHKQKLLQIVGLAAAIAGIYGSAPALASQPNIRANEPTIAQAGADVLFNRGVQKLQQKNYQGAVADFSALIELEPDNANAYLGRAIAYRYQENYQAAIKDYDESLRLNPENADAYLGRGICKRRLQNDQGAIDDYTAALRYNEDYGQAYYNRGLSKVDIGDREGAIEDFRQAARLYNEQELTQYYEDALERIAELERAGIR